MGKVCCAPPEPDLPDVDLSEEEIEFLNDFRAALRRFQALSSGAFRREFGPNKNYREVAAFRFVRGDANHDSGVDLSDAVCMLHYLFAPRGICSNPSWEDPFDADDSGDISITDPIYLLGHLFTGGPRPPSPFPAAGTDTTEDALHCPETARTVTMS